jgi:hypothetical protein
MLSAGPPEGTDEHTALEKGVGFSYWQILGELIYAYVICGLNIGFAITLLARFAQAPSQAHYMALKGVTKYLCCTKDWGIVYWRKLPVDSLPAVPFDQPVPDPALPSFPLYQFLQLVGFVDAAHAVNIKTRRSVTGLVFCLAGGAIAYKLKLQATVATSSTEAEFIGAGHAAKIAKYLRSVLAEFGFRKLLPPPLRRQSGCHRHD